MFLVSAGVLLELPELVGVVSVPVPVSVLPPVLVPVPLLVTGPRPVTGSVTLVALLVTLPGSGPRLPPLPRS